MSETALTKEQKQLILDISEDFYRYADNNLWIKDKDAQIVPFRPNKAQKAVIDSVLESLAKGEPIRLIVLKARQMGLSTAIEAIIYWWTTTHKNITAMIVGHEDASSKNLYLMFKRYYENCNPIFQPTRRYNTRQDLVFDVSDELKAQAKKEGRESPGLGSLIKTGTAQNVSTGRSDTIQLLHGSEIGEWDNGEELVASLLQTVPARANTMIFLESTANGMGNYFHREWENSMKGDGVFKPFFFPWWQHDEYEFEGEVGEYNDEELAIIELFKAAKIPKDKWGKKILFRRYKEKEFKSDRLKLYQEYPSTDYEAFLASGRPRFDIESLVHYKSKAEDVIVRAYDMKEDTRKTVSVQESVGAPLKIWDMPERGVDYVIGADVAEGLKDGDYSVADVVRTSDLKTVARWRGHIDPDLFGNVIDKLGRLYNFALVGVEINNHGLTTVQRLRDLFYTNLYRRERGIDERFEESTSKLGWKTDLKTKPLMIDYLAEAIREKLITDYDPIFVREAMTYVIDDAGRTNAEEGCFDDTVMAKAIALQMFEWTTNNKSSLKAYKPDKVRTRKKAHKVIR